MLSNRYFPNFCPKNLSISQYIFNIIVKGSYISTILNCRNTVSNVSDSQFQHFTCIPPFSWPFYLRISNISCISNVLGPKGTVSQE